MHFGNGQAEALRKDGASPPVLGLRICPLFLLAAGLLLGLGSGASAGWCQPCPGNCTCANDSCLVNCSGGGLQELEAVPANVTVLDISNNNIETLDQELFEQLQNLTEINLSDNPWSCDCRLSWLPRWAAKSGISVVQADSTVCDRPYVASGQQLFNVSFSKSLCGSDLIYCPSSPSTDNESVSIFVPISLTHASNETCSAQCYAELYNFWALDSKHGCLCGDVLPSNASLRCREVCDTPSLLSGCGLTIIQDVLRTESFSSLHASSDVYRLGESVHLQVEAPVPVTPLLWDLGSQVFSTSEVSITHRYAQPGVYNVTVTLKFGSRDLLLHEELRVVGIPEEVKLLCPSLVRTNETVDVRVMTIGGTDMEVQYTVTSQDDMPVSPVCPLGSVVYPNNNHCYQLISEKAGWFEAQKTCQEWGNGDMAVVSSLELQSFLKAHVTSGLEVWIGFNDSRSSESLPAGKRFDLESCQNWLPGQPEPSQADRCVRMGPNGVCNTDLCSATHNYVCEYKPQAVSLNAEYFVVGSLVFDTNWPLQNLTRVESVSSSIGEVEVLVFPSLRFSQEVYISALEFVTEEVLEPVQMRFQVYTQSTEHDCPSQSTSSPPSSLPIKESLPDCEEEPDSSNYTNSTLPVESGCFPSSESKDATSSLMAPSNKSLPNLTLLKEYLFTIPAGNATQYLAMFEDASVQMLPNYLIVLQHDAPNKKFLHCHSSRSYHVFYQSDWVTCIPRHFLGEALINGTSESSWGQQELYDGGLSCSLRVVGTTKEVASVFSDQLNPGLWQPGKYTITANFTNQLYKATQYYSFSVVSPVSGLSVIYPTPENKVYYIPSDDPVLILKILSGSDSTAFWAGSNQTWSFSRTCPPKISAVPTECTMDKGDISYSEVNLLGLGRGAVEVLITVQNEISSQNITCLVKMEDPIRGLSASPSPQARVLLNTRVNNVASVEAGSDVIFKWTVDDRPSFTFYNTVFNVIYQSAAMYKLALTASNHVSNASVNYNVTVEKMNPMRDLKISGIPAIVTQYDSLLLSASIIIDSAVDVIFLWLFGDGTQLDYNVRPPYNQSFSVPDPAIHMVLVENSVTHTYQETGSYNVSLLVFNKYENMSKFISLQVQSILTNITIETDAEVLVSGRLVSFRAAAEPSSFGVIYSWDLGDGTNYHNNSEPVVNHTYNNPGSFNVSIWALNDISEITVVQTFCVYEEITGLVVESDEPTERGMQTFINASVKSGDAIIWRFDMGDGYILEGNEPMVNYTYSKDGNYTVNVTARNLVNFLSEILQVRVYVLQILKIEPSICILENSNVTLTAHVTGDYQTYTFNWTFDNGSSIITVYGVPSVQYDSSKSGIFPLSLILSSQVNKAYYYTNICIEPEIVNVTLLPALQNVSLGNESLFKVIVFPHYQYRYNWDFGTNGSKYNGGTEVSFVYKVPGVYQVTVSVFNNVSFHNGTSIVDVQEPIGALNIKHNGSEILALDEVYLFEALGDGTKVEHHWDFGDGFTDQRQSVGHAYNRTGTFTINLYGYNSVSCNRTHLNVTVKTKIQGLTMNATRTIVPLNGSVTFSAFLQAGDNVRYSWILCDRCSAIFCNSTISYTFRSIGTFNVIVTAENELGSLQDSIIIYVLEIIEGLQIITGDLVNDCCFPTNKSLPLQATVKDGTNISYSWFILKNDSVVQTGAGRTYQFISLQPESYTIVLKAVNMLGNASVSMSVVFVESLGQVQLSAHPNPVAVNTTVNISMSLSSGSGVMYTWHLEESVVWFTYESFVLYNFLNPNTKEVLAIANNTLGLVNSAITIFVQEPVEGLSITSPYHKSDYVPTGTLVYLLGSVQRGTNVSWIWSIGHQEGRSANVLFDKSGFYTVSLNASNDVSWEIAYKNVTVQDRICGLKLLVSKMVVEPGERVTFNVIMSAGTDVTYKLTINGDFSILLNGTSYTHNFTKIGGYPVTVVAHNQVSEERDTVMISVLEAIENLKIVNCCERALPARIEKSFRAEVSNGSLVAYTWQFDLQGYPPTSLAGRNVTYTPVAAGVLRVYLSASNALGSQNISKEIKIQELIVSVTLVPVKTFVNRSATFTAVVVPSPIDVQFEWTFGDIDYTLVTNVSTAKHIYLTPGDFLVKVNASNQISFRIAEMTVTTWILQCEEPEVQLELPTQVIMRRSQRNYIEAEINLRGCISYKTEHLWEIYKASSCLSYHESDKVHLLNVDMSRPQLVLPKLALDIGNYCFVFSVSFGDTPLSRSSFANVTMSPSRLVPIIDGGSYRVWSSSRDLILDGKKSYDPNLEEDEQTPLTYKWSCTTLTKNLENTVCNSEVMSELGEVSIHKSKLHPDVEYTFFLTVSKPERHPESTNQTVLIKKGKVPIVSLKCVSCKAQSVYEVSASSYVYLEGSCTNCHDDSRTGRWTAQSFRNKTLVLNSTTTTTGNREMNLVLRQGVLKDGEGYTFTLHVSDPTMEEEGYASIDLLPNSPPFGGTCRISPNETIHALTTLVHFNCTGWRDTEDEVALVFILRAKRCWAGHCDDFWVYKGSRSEHSTFLSVGYQQTNFVVELSILVQDQQGATAVALNQSLVISMPKVPEGFQSLGLWLHNLTDTTLQGLLKQGDPQYVAQYSLALITVLNEYEQAVNKDEEISKQNLGIVRNKITDALISLKVNTVDDIRQIAAALAQCTVASQELACTPCQRKTLSKLEAMMSILQNETTQGMMTPTTIADNILNITGDVIQLVNTKSSVHKGGMLCDGPNNVTVASEAYNLSSDLMRIMMKSRVLNEEPLTLQGGEILARGKRSDPLNLLCYSNRTGCQFFIPQGFNSTFPDLTDIIQVMIQVDSNPYPFGFISNYNVSTKVASMEFQTSNGSQIPLESLDSEKAITVIVANNTGVSNITAGVATVESRRSMKVDIEAESSNEHAGLHIQITYKVLDEWYNHMEQEPYISAYLHETDHPNQYNYSAMKQITLDAMKGDDHKLYTFFITPKEGNLTRHYYLNITNHYMWSSVEVTVGMYTSLCQYFDGNERKWKTEGVTPLEDTRSDQAVCLTQHLTAFGASLFVPPHSVNFIYPPPPPGINYIVLLTCAVCFVTYSVATIIVHKLDLLDVSKAGVIPFCGKAGVYKYEVLVKTGWGRGSGTTAHVGISLYGVDNKSGHRHLDGENTFRRNSVDIFQIATEKSLGNVWKIRLWHDNKGLSPSWYIQHVIIRDLQSSKNFFFLVNDWLSVGQEDSGRRVEKEIFAASETELKRFSRIFMAELQRGISEKHVWLSMWDRPPRSRFTRVQRATCCAVLIFLFLCANAVWYGVVGDRNHGDGAVSLVVPFSVDSVAAGLVTSILVYPIYLFILFLFRRARSKTCVRPSLTYFDQNSLEIDNYLDNMMMESSFMTYTGINGEGFSDQTKTEIIMDDTKGFIQWSANDGMLSWPDLLSDPTIMGNSIQKLEKHRNSQNLGLDGSSHPSEEDNVVLGLPSSIPRHFLASDGASSMSLPPELRRISRTETDLLSDLSNPFADKTETIMLDRLNEKGQTLTGPPREVTKSIKSNRTVITDAFQRRGTMLPSWCTRVAHVLSCFLLFCCFGVSVWIGVGFTSSVGLMWLISGIFSFLFSFFVLEPLKVMSEALYFALVVKRLHPEEEDTLVECPLVEHVSERVTKVRPPQGFALFQAREEARKVKLLHRMLKNLVVYMLFFLVVLLTNYGDASVNSSAYLLQRSVRRELASQRFLQIRRSEDFWAWASDVLLPYLGNIQRGSYSNLLGSARLRQIRLKKACRHGACPEEIEVFDEASYDVSWLSSSFASSQTWLHSPPDNTGAWYWGYMSFYDSSGYIQQLGASLEENEAIIGKLQQDHWIDNLTRALFVEFSLYSPGVELYSSATFLLEFPMAGRTLPSTDVRAFPLLRLSSGPHLLLVMMVFLMMFVVYFVLSECLVIRKEGRQYFTHFWNYIQWLMTVLSVCTVVVDLSRGSLADEQWDRYLKDRAAFLSLHQVAFLSSTFHSLSASVLFILTIKAAQQLRFIREWSMFGKTLSLSMRELCAAAGAVLGLLLVYAQLGFLLFSSSWESFHNFGSSVLSLFSVARGAFSLKIPFPYSSCIHRLYFVSYQVLELWILVKFFAAILVKNYRQVRLDMFRPAFELQDYEMVELFLRRLRIWMGVSKVKEFRHKVRFEGMEPLPSRASSDTKSLRGSTPSAASDTSSSSSFSTISSQLDTLSAMSTRERAEVDANMQRLLPVLETLLSQFDVVNSATEDVYQIERSLEEVRGRVAKRRKHAKASTQKILYTTEVSTGLNRSFTTTQSRSSKSEPYPRVSKNSLAPRPSTVSQALENSSASKGITVDKVVTEEPALIPMQLSHSSQTKRRKSMRAHNRVHPSVS